MFLIDPCGIICVAFTYILVLYADYILAVYMIIPTYGLSTWGWVHLTILNALILTILSCQAIALFTDPGRLRIPLDRKRSLWRQGWRELLLYYYHPLPVPTLPLYRSPPVPCCSCLKPSPKARRQSSVIAAAAEISLQMPSRPPISAAAPKPRDDLSTPSSDCDETRVGGDKGRQEEGADDREILDDSGQRLTWCRKCQIYRPPGAHHCSTCRVCVASMDHHCPWINNCVGHKNQKCFILLLVYSLITCVYAIGLTATPWIRRCVTCPDNVLGNAMFLHSIILVFVCLLFITFVAIILCDQLKSALAQESLVERRIRYLKGKAASKNSSHVAIPADGETLAPKIGCLDALSFICGTNGPSIKWIIPCIPPANSYKDLMGVKDPSLMGNRVHLTTQMI